MRRAAGQRRWHAIARRYGSATLGLLLLIYCLSPHVGFIAKGSSGPIFLARPGAIGIGYLTEQAQIQDIPQTPYLGLYFPTTPTIWRLLPRDDTHGVRLYIPYWIPIGGVIAMMAWVSYSARPLPQGACPACGYDLTGCTVIACECCRVASVECPECGSKTQRPMDQVSPDVPTNSSDVS